MARTTHPLRASRFLQPAGRFRALDYCVTNRTVYDAHGHLRTSVVSYGQFFKKHASPNRLCTYGGHTLVAASGFDDVPNRNIFETLAKSNSSAVVVDAIFFDRFFFFKFN